MSNCIYYSKEPKEMAYCDKFKKYLDYGCGECKEVTFADVVEVRHGQWIRTGQSYINPNKFLCLTCSCCLSDLDEHIRKEPRYCPNCGARMDGEEHEHGTTKNA